MTTNVGCLVQLSKTCQLVYNPDQPCQVCQGRYWFEVTEGNPPTTILLCTLCEFIRAGRESITVQGWNVTKLSNQVVCTRIPRGK